MPKAYLIAHVTLTNAERFMGEYGSKVADVFAEFGGKFLVRGGEVPFRGDVSSEEPVAWSGGPVDLDVVIEFPDMAAAQSALQSESYKAILAGRTENGTGPIVLVAGVDDTGH